MPAAPPLRHRHNRRDRGRSHVSAAGTVSLGQHIVLAAEILAGRRVGIRIEPTTLMMFDLDTRELLRNRPNR
ncbi:hypothetical protein Asera_37180 [Actinocatenispora sera]|uniref:Uncharacterized protein n=1 Tax=Actinocatenispora sera TaxID=390989 RepID=A0A810L247_9ACTN|nr:hypothetical protein Asera_37180 [Actinocatenispora sera]